MPSTPGLRVWADLLYAPASPVPDTLVAHVDASSVDPLRWKLVTTGDVGLAGAFRTWRRQFIHTLELGPVEDLTFISGLVESLTGDVYPLNRPRSFDQASFTAAWEAAKECVPDRSPLLITVHRLGAAAALSRTLGLSAVLRMSAHSWPQSTQPAPDPLPFDDPVAG